MNKAITMPNADIELALLSLKEDSKDKAAINAARKQETGTPTINT